MRIAIIYNDPGESAPDQDVLVQKNSVKRVLTAAGHACVPVACTLDLASFRHSLQDARIDCVFNLVESLDGTDRLSALVLLLLDSMRVPYTGSSALTLLQTADKLTVKQKLKSLKLPTPAWLDDAETPILTPGRFIIKPRFEHASMGINDDAVVTASSTRELARLVQERSRHVAVPLFAETFVEGREFNIAVIADETGTPQVLPPAEIDFSSFPPAKPRIVGYNAKWAEDSFEYHATPRNFTFSVKDRELLDLLTRLTISAWHAFELGGYARVDFRVDESGNPYILEINTNPCLSPDAGFAAALAQSGLSYQTGMLRIVAHAMGNQNR